MPLISWSLKPGHLFLASIPILSTSPPVHTPLKIIFYSSQTLHFLIRDKSQFTKWKEDQLVVDKLPVGQYDRGQGSIQLLISVSYLICEVDEVF